MSSVVKNRALTPIGLSDTGGQCLQAPDRLLGLQPDVLLEGFGTEVLSEMRPHHSPRQDLKKVIVEPGAVSTAEILAWRRPPWLSPWKTVPAVSIPDRWQVD